MKAKKKRKTRKTNKGTGTKKRYRVRRIWFLLPLFIMFASFIYITAYFINLQLKHANARMFVQPDGSIPELNRRTPFRTPRTPSNREDVLEENQPTQAVVNDVEEIRPQRETETPVVPERDRRRVVNPDLPKVSIIVDDFGGISSSLFERFNSLDSEVAFAVLPDLSRSVTQMERAVAAGREVLIHIPMEPENSNESLEPNTIMTSMSDLEIRSQIETWMFELHLAVGVNNHMGSRATQDERVLHTIMSTLRQSDLFFIDSKTSPNSRIEQVANRLGVRTNARDIFLDLPDSSTEVASQKVEEIKQMRNRDFVIVITHCHNEAKYQQLVYFIERLKDEGFQLVKPSVVVR